MKLSFRWYGENDSVPLEYIAQIPNMHSVASAVYDVKAGELWSEKSIEKIKNDCQKHGLKFDIAESIPVHENIKLGSASASELTEIYCENIRRCAKYGINCITYNFMPVFDWIRTQLDKKAPDGSTTLVMYREQLNTINPLSDDISLPGWASSYNQNELKSLISAYSEIGEEGLWKNLENFMKKVIPTAEGCGIKMAIHPDDPPYPLFGIPRIITCEKNLDRVLNIVDSPSNTLCLCTGSLGCASSNDVTAMVKKYAQKNKISFMHIRNVKNLNDGSFEESAHYSLCGSLDICEIVYALVENGFDGYVRPDHGRMIWGENGKPGYGLYDRALGATYINGLFEACEKSFKKSKR